MKYVKANAEAIELENNDIVTVSEQAVHNFLNSVGPGEDHINQLGLSNGMEGLIRLLNEHPEIDLDSFTEWGVFKKAIHEIKNHCEEPGANYSADVEDDFDDAEW